MTMWLMAMRAHPIEIHTRSREILSSVNDPLDDRDDEDDSKSDDAII